MSDAKPGQADQRLVLMERRGAVALLTLNRPESMNAINSELARELGDAVAEFAADDSLRVAVLTGAGRAFCAGADLKVLAAGGSVHDDEHLERGFAGFVRQFVDKPVIAAVNGFALGGGTEIVLACDLTVMGQGTSLGLPEVRGGLVAAAGGLLRLHRQMPPKVAAEAIFTGQPISASTALQWGLVNRVVPDADVVAAALDLAAQIAENAPLALRASKRIMARSSATSDWDPSAWQMNEAEFVDVRASRDAREGATAFAEKRRPQWTGA
jgi:crotonobetainyl-CoA hydratase